MSATSNPRSLVLRTAGTNCDHETELALEKAGSRVELSHLHRVLAEPGRLDDFELLVVPGGFSYGDDVAAGRVFGLELRHHLSRALFAFVERGGLVLGVCNGFQVLVDTGLLEGPDRLGSGRDIALAGNDSGRFECRWVMLEAQDCACPWLSAGELLPCPVAHAEGRFAVREPAALERLRERRQIALRYVSADGGGRPARYPDCPNGSVEEIAGICDPSGRVLGLMPHPERNIEPWHHPHWTRLPERRAGEGLAFYRNMVETAARGALEGAS